MTDYSFVPLPPLKTPVLYKNTIFQIFKFQTLSNFDTHGAEYLHQFVQYSCFVHFKTSNRIQSVNMLCHKHTTCLIIKICNHN